MAKKKAMESTITLIDRGERIWTSDSLLQKQKSMVFSTFQAISYLVKTYWLYL